MRGACLDAGHDGALEEEVGERDEDAPRDDHAHHPLERVAPTVHPRRQLGPHLSFFKR